MKSFNCLAACVLVTGVFGLSACVFAGPGHEERDSRQAEARRGHDNVRHDDDNRRCDSDHHGGGCQDSEHH